LDIIQENIRVIQNLQKNKKIEITDEIYEMIELVAETSNFSISKLQEEYIRNINFLIPFLQKMYTITEEMEWPYQAESIFLGKFPLERIPIHIRPIAEKLYYNKKD
jgi:hypothetical protein